jgi:DNA polymerase (family X)
MDQQIYESNRKIFKVLNEIGIFLEMDDEFFKSKAYKKAAGFILDLNSDISNIYREGGTKALENLPSIGVSIAEKIEEFLMTKKIHYYQKLRKKWPIKLEEFIGIEGLGTKTLKYFYEELGIKKRRDLERALKQNKISKLPGFGEKTQEKILRSIKFYKRFSGRFVLGFIMPEIISFKKRFEKVNGVKKVDIAGSARRRKETVGDVDFLIVAEDSKFIIDFFTNMPEIEKVIAKGKTKASIKLKYGLNMDIRVVSVESHGAALNYFTGSKKHNIALREIAMKKKYKLNEYGLFKTKNKIAGETEEGIYKKLGLKYIEPELRETTGEIEASRKGKLPKLIKYSDLAGDLHTHTEWSDGANSIEGMARAAMEKGLNYIAITDHSKRLKITNGLDEKRIKNQWRAIDLVNKKFKKEGLNFHILKGAECDILKDGSMDLSDNILSKLDIVGASIHSFFNLTEKEQTERIKKAMQNKNVDIICHPTGRIINQREPYKININELIKTAKDTGTILEINSFPIRLDIKDVYIKECVKVGVKMCISSDGHMISNFDYLEYGIAQARRGWAQKNDIINTYSIKKMLKLLKHA